MNPQSSFQRKIIYLVAIVGLLILLSFLGRPATIQTEQTPEGSPGGWLAELRVKYGLHQAELGQIDASNETIKLATFGLRGVAANILWGKAQRYKKKKDWTNLRATVNQITKLQPNFVSVWIFQAWNQSHNISVEFDDVRERYRWVIKGIRFLQEGAKYNARESRLPWEAGWVLSHKIGRSDEYRQFRKMFIEDDDFHGPRAVPLRDNWLVGKEWFRKAEALADTVGGKMKGKGPLIYRSSAPMAQMYYAETLEKEGHFGEKARLAWKQAAEEWHEYGKIDLPTGLGIIIQLNAKERHDEEALRLSRQIDELAPDLREQIRQAKRAELSEEQRQALDTPLKERNAQQYVMADEAERLIEVTDRDVAGEIAKPNRRQALQLAREAAKERRISQLIASKRHTVNFEYWRRRAAMEQTDEAIAARELLYDAYQDFEEDKQVAARQKYEQGFALWRKLLDQEQFRPMVEDPTFGPDMMEEIYRYARVLELLDEKFPEDFILQDIVDLHKETR